MSALFDFSSLLVVILLLICTSVYLRAQWLKRDEATGHLSSLFEAGGTHKGGLLGMGWKAARIGERLSPYIAVSCVVMAVSYTHLTLPTIYSV